MLSGANFFNVFLLQALVCLDTLHIVAGLLRAFYLPKVYQAPFKCFPMDSEIGNRFLDHSHPKFPRG